MSNCNLKYFTIISVCFLAFISCKKDKNVAIIPDQINTSGSRADLTKDSIFLYAKQVYLWNDALPTYEAFNPRQYNSSTNQFTNFESELFTISQLKKDPNSGLAYEYIANSNGVQIRAPKFSYIEDLVASGKLTVAPDSKSAIQLTGEGNDFGVALAAVGISSNYKIYLRYTSPSSPAVIAGLARGDIIEQINGIAIGSNFDAEVNTINSAFDTDTKSTVTIAGVKKNGSRFNLILNKAKYTSSPIYKDTILNVGTKKVGYFAYARFSNTANSVETLNGIFTKFSNGGVTDLVIDLRYNGGGFISTAKHLINLIAPLSINSKTMFAETYNSLMQSGGASLLRNQPLKDQNGNAQYTNGRLVTYADVNYSVSGNTYKFEKTGPLSNISKVVFIVTDKTASASELVINSLKPYIDVKIVGKKSYGKPVGFFPIRIDKYDVYFSLFTTANSLGEGNYYAGFTPDAERADDVTRDFGNPSEVCLSSALSYINSGVFTSSVSNQTMSIDGKSSTAASLAIRDAFVPRFFNGMIAEPKSSKKD